MEPGGSLFFKYKQTDIRVFCQIVNNLSTKLPETGTSFLTHSM